MDLHKNQNKIFKIQKLNHIVIKYKMKSKVENQVKVI